MNGFIVLPSREWLLDLIHELEQLRHRAEHPVPAGGEA